MVNCGRCGKPIHKPGVAVCDSCRRTISKDASRHANRMNWRKDQEEDLYLNIAYPGKEEEDLKDDLGYQHYVDTHDATEVWVDEEHRGGRGRRRR